MKQYGVTKDTTSNGRQLERDTFKRERESEREGEREREKERERERER